MVAWRVPLLALVPSLVASAGISPFLMVSGDRELPQSRPEMAVDSNMNWVNDALIESTVKGCNYDSYVFVDQPSIGQRDINEETMPFLSHIFSKARDSIALSNVRPASPHSKGSTAQDPEEYVINTCGATVVDVDIASGAFKHYEDAGKSRFFHLKFPSVEDRRDLIRHDEILHKVVGHTPTRNFLVVFRTTPVASGTAVGPEPVHSSLTAFATESQGEREKINHDSSLFAKYQFFSPALFMGLVAVLVIGSILMIALQWLTELQVSQGSFTKQAATRKQG